MAGRKAKCLQCTQVIVVPDPERHRWPPGMEPPGMKAPVNSAPPKQAKPASPQPGPASRAPNAKPITPAGAGAPPQASPAIPVAKAVPVAPPAVPVAQAVPITPQAVPVAAPVASPVAPPQVPQAKPIRAAVAETVSDDIDDLLAYERGAAPLAPARPPGDNPYHAPQAATDKARASSDRGIRFGETLETAWRIYKANFGTCLAASILSTVALTASIAALNFSVVKFADIVKQNEWQSVTLGITVLFTFVTLFFSTIMFFSLGLVEFLLQIAKGRDADFSRLVGAADLLFSGLGLLVLVILSAVVGLVLLVIPGLFVIFLFALAPIALVDRQEGAIDALATSAKLVSANLATVALLILLTGLGFGLLSVITCGFGPLVTGPFQMLVMIVLYMRASGKRLGID